MMQQVFGGTKDWKQTLRDVLHLDPAPRRGAARIVDEKRGPRPRDGIELHPVQFAKMVVDENFAELVGKPLK